MNITFFGIDPGMKGALARIGSNGASVMKMKKLTRDNTAGRIATLVEAIGEHRGNKHFTIEFQNARPPTGRSACFTMGVNFGAWCTAIRMAKYPLSVVTPGQWKRSIITGVKDRKSKEASITVARRLFPFAEFKTHDEAEALLIAEYGRRQWHGGHENGSV